MEDRTVLSHGCRKTNKLICGMEGENVMAYGLLPARLISRFFFKLKNIISNSFGWTKNMYFMSIVTKNLKYI